MPKWPGDHEAKHAAAARKGWAARRAKGTAPAAPAKPAKPRASAPAKPAKAPRGEYTPKQQAIINDIYKWRAKRKEAERTKSVSYGVYDANTYGRLARDNELKLMRLNRAAFNRWNAADLKARGY